LTRLEIVGKDKDKSKQLGRRKDQS